MAKRILSIFTTLVMACSLVGVFSTVTAGALTYGDYKYKIFDNSRVKITKYTGNATKLVIPNKIGKKKVSSIGKFAFFECPKLSSVIIPKSVKEIADSAFLGCDLKKVKILNKSTYEQVTKIDSNQFCGTPWFNKIVKKKMKKVKVNGIKATSKSKEKINVSWNKVKKIDGYYVEAALNKNFKDYLITNMYIYLFQELTNKNNCILNVDTLSGSNCYVRVRAFKFISKGSRSYTVYGKWSKPVKVKVK